jgi:DNA polymerase-1
VPTSHSAYLLSQCLPTEMATAALLGRMERAGCGAVDVSYLKACRVPLLATLHRLEAEAHALAGHPFLLTSPQQVSAVLFTEMGLQRPSSSSGRGSGAKQTATNTGEESLNKLAKAGHELPRVILGERNFGRPAQLTSEISAAPLN